MKNSFNFNIFLKSLRRNFKTFKLFNNLIFSFENIKKNLIVLL